MLAISPSLYPYPPSTLDRFDAFELWPLDGGAFFFLHEHLGCASGAACLAALQDGRLLAPWKSKNRIDWDSKWDQPGAGALKRPIEQHVWINRLYFLLPLALEVYRSGNRALLQQWITLFADWSSAHPMPAEHGQPAVASKYVWYDMQIAWRLNVLIHSVRLLAGTSAIRGMNGRRIRDAIGGHAAILCRETARVLSADIRPPAVGNHFLQKGTVLLFAGVLLPECVDAAQCVNFGIRALERHRASDLLDDGGNVESSPSYSHFIARLYADAYRLLSNAPLGMPAGLLKTVRNQYEFLARTAGPDGRSLQINDSYSLDIARDRAVAGHLVPLSQTVRNTSRWFRESGQATIRAKRFSIHLDASPATLYHHHAGKPNLLIFADGQPLLIDAGCCNYDREAWTAWFRSAGAHNTILVSSADRPRQWFAGPVSVRIRRATRTRMMVETHWRSESFTCCWEHKLIVAGRWLRIEDRMKASCEVVTRQIFLIGSPDVTIEPNCAEFTAYLGPTLARFTKRDRGNNGYRLGFRPTMDRNNAVCIAAEVHREQAGRVLRFVTVIELRSKTDD